MYANMFHFNKYYNKQSFQLVKKKIISLYKWMLFKTQYIQHCGGFFREGGGIFLV